MHARNRLGVALLACGIAFAAGAAEPPSASDCFVAGFKSGNADTVGACYAEDAIMWFPGGSMAKGRAAIRDGFAHFLGTVTVKDMVLTPIGEIAMGDTKTTWGTYAITVVDKATKAESVQHGRFTDVSRKIDGRWLYIVDHPSDDPAPAAE